MTASTPRTNDNNYTGTSHDLSLYLVSEGNVTPASADTECDWSESIIVAATSEHAALAIAQAWDQGRVQQDTLMWGDRAICVVCMRDPHTALYR